MDRIADKADQTAEQPQNRKNGNGKERKRRVPQEDTTAILCEICTDVDAATRFFKTYRTCVQWNNEWGWVYWKDNNVWCRDTGEVIHKMAEGIGQQYRNLIPDFKEPSTASGLARWAKHCESTKGIRDFLVLAQHRFFMPADEFDKNQLLVNTNNVTLDFGKIDGKVPRFYNHTHTDYITKKIAKDWNIGARAVRWNEFLAEIFPSEELRAFIQRAVGYSLLGITREQCFFVCWGGGANGKSTFLNVLLRVFGSDYAVQADPNSFMSGQIQQGRARNDMADLRGIRLVAAIETGDGIRLNEGLIKAITGGDSIRANYLYQDAFTFRPEFKLWFGTNHRPTIKETTLAMWRRVRLIPFTVTIPEEKRNPNLENLLLSESEGVLSWAVDGAIEYMAQGLNPPAEVLAATEEYRCHEDVIAQFIQDCCILDKNAQVAKGELYKVYTEWAEQNGDRPMTQRKLSANLQERGLDEYRMGDSRTRYWIGIGLNAR